MKVNVKESYQCTELHRLCKGNWYIREADRTIGIIIENPFQDTGDIEVIEFILDDSKCKSNAVYHKLLSKFMIVTPCKVEMEVVKCMIQDAD